MERQRRSVSQFAYAVLIGGILIIVLVMIVPRFTHGSKAIPASRPMVLAMQPRPTMDLSGMMLLLSELKPWRPDASLEEVRDHWQAMYVDTAAALEQQLASASLPDDKAIELRLSQAMLLNAKGQADQAYEVLAKARSRAEHAEPLAAKWMAGILYAQGVTALRRGENDNCIMCRGECSCILPIVPAAVHTNRTGSRLAIQHFTEYLQQFPKDLEVRWLLNVAHMTLGEHPQKVDPQFLISLEKFSHSEFDIGRFRDVGVLAGVSRFNQAGGAIMDDFDNDGLLDIVTTSWDAAESMAFFHNSGNGTFEDRTSAANLGQQLGGLFCVQTDYNNDGHLDIFVARGAWLKHPIRPSLLRNNGSGVFTDVTAEAGLLHPSNSNSAAWADYDNDGDLDLVVPGEQQDNRLYRNKGDGRFEDVTVAAGLMTSTLMCKAAIWIDYDNDDYQDLYFNYLSTGGHAQLYHNNRDGTFTEETLSHGIQVGMLGFSCWAWDYDNDGWLDLFSSCYDRSLQDVVKGFVGEPHTRMSSKLFRNIQGKRFQDVTHEMGLEDCYAAMGSNFCDFDNDGFLDMYLGTGEPTLATLVPNRMFKNVAGQRFAEITGSTGTGHLQKGHGVACGDWNRDGNNDLFVEIGGVVHGDQYHNALFQNPGQGHHWLTVKLIGQKTNRPAIGARIKVVTAGQPPLTVHRVVSSGSSFGANSLQQTIGIGKADRIATLEIHWPTSGTTQVFRDLDVNQALEITEFADSVQKLDWQPIALPAQSGR